MLFQYPYAYEGPVLAVEGSGGYLIGQGQAWGPQGAPSPNILILAEGSSQTFDVALLHDHWYHLAAVRQGNDLSVHLDGTLVGTIRLNGRNRPNGTLRFGRAATGQLVNNREAQFYGKLADVVIYSRALSPQDLAKIVADHHVGAGDPSVVARWGFVRDRFRAVLSGAAQRIARDRKWNGVTDVQNMPLPANIRTQLPFAPGDAWYTVQGWGRPTSYSHYGYAAFCWDFIIADYPSGGTYPSGTMQAPIHAACSGSVVEAYDQQPLATAQPDNWVRIQAADGLLRDCQHLLTGSAVVSKGQSVAQGQQIAKVSLFPNNAHLHMAGSNNTGGVSSVTVPLAISDYEVRQPGGTWRPVARGIPQPGEVVRLL